MSHIDLFSLKEGAPFFMSFLSKQRRLVSQRRSSCHHTRAVEVLQRSIYIETSIIIYKNIMSSGGGIARFASRMAVTSTGDAAAPTPSENSATKFSFSFNDNSDALSATSDDEFGFLGGGGSSVGGDDFFMMNDGGFNHESDTLEHPNGSTTMATTEVSSEGNSIHLI